MIDYYGWAHGIEELAVSSGGYASAVEYAEAETPGNGGYFVQMSTAAFCPDLNPAPPRGHGDYAVSPVVATATISGGAHVVLDLNRPGGGVCLLSSHY